MAAFIAFFFLGTILLHGQAKVGNNTSVVEPSAAFEIEHDSKGFLLPRLTTSQRNALASPAHGLMVFNVTEGCLNVYNGTDSLWASVCGSSNDGSAVFEVECSSLLIAGVYSTGVPLNPEDHTVTITVDVVVPGTYNIVAQGTGMYFVGAGEFLETGRQSVVLGGQGIPVVFGTNAIALQVGTELCSTVLNVGNGLAQITGCGTLVGITGDVYANERIVEGSVYVSYAPGPSYTGGSTFGLISNIVNGIRIASPANGTLTGSGSPIDYVISGKPILPGSTVLQISINSFGCPFPISVQSGTGRASAVTCGGALAGTYEVGTAATAANTKVINLTVTTAGTFYVRTNTANGIYFEGQATLAAGARTMTLTAVGTPQAASPTTYTVTVSSSAIAFQTCTFNVTPGLPGAVPDFASLPCGTFGATAAGGINYVKANNTDANDRFGGFVDATTVDGTGKAVSISGDGLTLAVGAPYEDGSLAGGAINSINNNLLRDAGAVYVYSRPNTASNWVFQAKIKPVELGSADAFGHAVDISSDGNTLLVGSLFEDGSGTGVNPVADNEVSNAGAAYVFTRAGTVWTQQASLKPPSTALANEYFGAAVAISGDGTTAVIGAHREDGSGAGINPVHNDLMEESGAVYIYTRTAGVWTFDATIKAHGPGRDDRFGFSVSVNSDGTTVAVGAPREDGSGAGVNPAVNNSTTNAGAAYVFVRTAGLWSQQAYIKSLNAPRTSDEFGTCVDLSDNGNTLVVGAPGEDGSGIGVNPGANTSASNSGAVFTYNRSGTAWSTGAYLKSTQPGSGDAFGRNVALARDGGAVVVGAVGDDANSTCINSATNNSSTNVGSTQLFGLIGGSWVPTFLFRRVPGMSNGTELRWGMVVDVDAAGRTAVIGSGNEDGAATGINGTMNNLRKDAGAVITWTRN
jgi:hypothetical protein